MTGERQDEAGTAGPLGVDPRTPFAEILLARAGRFAAAPALPVVSAVDRVAAAVQGLRRGGVVLLLRTTGGADQGHLVLPAATASPSNVSFLHDHGSGLIGVALPARRCAELSLTAVVEDDTARESVVFAVSVEAAGAPPGTSVAGLARTIRLLADPATVAGDLRRPGHVFPLIARDGGVLDGGGHAEAAVDLVRLAALPEAAVVCDVVVRAEGAAGRAEELTALAARHGLPVLRIEDLLVHRRLHQGVVRRGATTRLPTPTGAFTADLVVSTVAPTEVLVLRAGDLAEASAGEDRPAPLVGVHVECLLGDAFGSLRCGCAARLDQLLRAVAASGAGAVLYLRGEGRGSGLLDELVRQDHTGPGDPERPQHLLDVAADALHLLGARRVRLADDDPRVAEAIERLGIRVQPVPVPTSDPAAGDAAPDHVPV